MTPKVSTHIPPRVPVNPSLNPLLCLDLADLNFYVDHPGGVLLGSHWTLWSSQRQARRTHSNLLATGLARLGLEFNFICLSRVQFSRFPSLHLQWPTLWWPAYRSPQSCRNGAPKLVRKLYWFSQPSRSGTLSCGSRKVVFEIAILLGTCYTVMCCQWLIFIQFKFEESSQILTKKHISSRVAQIFDPMGWLAPAVITAKIFLQSLWLLKCDWDDKLPPLNNGETGIRGFQPWEI